MNVVWLVQDYKDKALVMWRARAVHNPDQEHSELLMFMVSHHLSLTDFASHEQIDKSLFNLYRLNWFESNVHSLLIFKERDYQTLSTNTLDEITEDFWSAQLIRSIPQTK